MSVSEMSPPSFQPSPHDLKLLVDRLAATELRNHQLQLQLAQTVHAMDHMRQYGSAPPSVSMPSQAAPILMDQSSASPAMMLPRAPITDATLYHSPMPAAATSELLHLPIQMGPNVLELEAQQRWMMHQQPNPNPYQQTGSSNHYPSTISAGIFPQEHSNSRGMRSSGIASSGGPFSLSMLGRESTSEREFGSLMCHYSGMPKAHVKGELYPSLFAKVNAIVQMRPRRILFCICSWIIQIFRKCYVCTVFPSSCNNALTKFITGASFLHPSAEGREHLPSLLTL
jgi:hypothetical protein